MTAEKLYWPQLDGLRALAFSMVFCSHLPSLLKLLPEQTGGWVTLVMPLELLRMWGWIGVELFFVLSAFLITTLLLKEREKYQSVSFKLFFTRRMLRIWPLYYTFLLLIFLVLPLIGWVGPQFSHIHWRNVIPAFVLPYLFFLTNFCFTVPDIPTPSYMIPPWSVAIEEQFYLFWGILLSRCQNAKVLWKLVFWGVIVAAMARWILMAQSGSDRIYYYNSLGHLDSLLFGVAVALLHASGQRQREWFQRHGAKLFVVPILVYVLMALFIPPLYTNHAPLCILYTLIPAACALFLSATLFWPPAVRLFSHPGLIAVGRISYGMYIFHVLMIKIAAQLTTGLFHRAAEHFELPHWLFCTALSFALTFLTATASWHLLEKRFYLKRLKYARIPSGFAAGD